MAEYGPITCNLSSLRVGTVFSGWRSGFLVGQVFMYVLGEIYFRAGGYFGEGIS